MYNLWRFIFCLQLFAIQIICGLSELEVQLVVPRYVERGSSAIMKCMHNVRPEILFKVTWLKVDTGKFFEFINGRNPPFRNFSVLGGEIDWENSNQTQVTLRDVDFDLSGQFYCEVSTDTPIFTKASGDELLSVFLPQTAPPTIKFRKRSPFAIGERLLALCNTTRARPAPHITWLINGKKVEEKFVRTHHVYSLTGKSHRRTQQQQHQQQLQQEYYQHQHQHQHSQYHQQYQIPHLPDRYDKSLRWSGRPGDDFAVHLSQYKEGYYHPASVYNNPFSSLTNIHDINDIHEVQHRSYENKHDVKKHLETKKHHKSSTHKYRRHINENALGIIRTTLNNGGFGPEPKKLNHEHNRVSNHGPMNQLVAGHQGPLSHPGGGRGVAQAAAAVIAAAEQEKGNKDAEKGMFSISQLNIELSEQHVDTTGRMEITCLATIPTAVGQGEQFADYKTFSVKVDIERPEISYASTAVPNIGMAALGNGHVPSAATATKAIVEMHMIYICLQIGSAALWLSRFYLIKY